MITKSILSQRKILYPNLFRKFGFENGNERIDTHTLKIRCDPSGSIILKKDVHKNSNEQKN